MALAERKERDGCSRAKMFEKLFGRKSGGDVRMPDVDVLDDIDALFDKARQAAREEGERPPEPPATPGRYVIIVTPGRMLKCQPCPAPGSMADASVQGVERMIPSTVKRNIAAIAYTELEALQKDAGRAIPFLGFLLGFAYIGHAVWVFEGHSSALAAGCRDADLLLVDSAMLPFLQPDWAAVASKAMRRPEIYIHDRASYSLKKLVRAS
jgi:hypothetical protein